MSFLKRFAVAFVALGMVVSIAGASAAFAVDGTVLDSDHVTGSFEDAGVYETAATEGQDRIAGELETALEGRADEIPAGITLDVDNRAAAEAALTEEYVAGAFSTNVEQLLAYLQGDADELALQVDLVPVKDSLGQYLQNDTITVDTATLATERGVNVTTAGVRVDSEMLVRLNEDRAGYEAARTRLRAQAVEGATVPVSIDENGSVVVETATFLRNSNFAAERDGVAVDTALLLAMNANRSGYQDARADIRSQGLQAAGLPIDVAEDGTVDVDTVDLVQESNVTYDRGNVTVDDGTLARLNANQSGYTGVRTDVRAQVLEPFPVEVDENGEVALETAEVAREIDFASATDRIDVTDDMIGRLNEGPAGYAAVRSDIREQVREGLPPMATSGQVDTVLAEINTELKDNATSQANSEYGEDVSEGTLQDIVALQNTVIDGLTDPALEDYDEYATRRDADEAALEDAFDTELDDGLREANAEIKADAAEQARTEYGGELGNETVADVIALQNTTVDGLTNPNLDDYDEYATRRDADEAALEASLTAELEDRLRDANEEIKTEAADQARSEYGDDVSGETMADIVALQHTVIDGLTHPDLTEYDEYTSQRDDAEAALAASVDDELTARLETAGEDVKADAADRIRTEYGDRLSEDALEDVIALQHTVVDGLTRAGLSSAEYASQRDDAEAALETSLAAELGDRIDDQVQDRIELGNVTGEGADALHTVRTGVSVLGTLALVLPLVFLALIGVVYAITRSVHRTVATTGYSLLIAGVGGGVVGVLVNGPVLDLVDTAFESAAEDLTGTGVAEAIRGLVDGLFGTLTTQSIVLATLGIVLVAVVFADNRGSLSR